jgi:hypothetical protein
MIELAVHFPSFQLIKQSWLKHSKNLNGVQRIIKGMVVWISVFKRVIDYCLRAKYMLNDWLIH